MLNKMDDMNNFKISIVNYPAWDIWVITGLNALLTYGDPIIYIKFMKNQKTHFDVMM